MAKSKLTFDYLITWGDGYRQREKTKSEMLKVVSDLFTSGEANISIEKVKRN